jgi:pimeloyl-ACP methyl ester carboxylesterase
MAKEIQDRFVDVSGVRTRYWKLGDSGPAVVLLAGIGCSVREWRANIAALAQSHRIYAVDMLGAGLTDKPDGDRYSLPQLARFTLDFMSTQGEEHACLIGNSLGGRIALECARLSPERVRAMVLVAPAGVGRETLINMRLPTVPVLGELMTRPSRAGMRMLWRSAFSDSAFVTEELVEEKYALASLPGAQAAFLRTLRGFVGLGGFRRGPLDEIQAALSGMTQPTLVVWGRDDRLLPVAQTRILKAKLPSCRVVVFDDCGHLPQIEKADAFNVSALEFLQSVP